MRTDTVAALFPGVGSEYAGMAARCYDRYPVVRQTFDEAADVLGFDLAELCLHPSAADRLGQQLNAQLAVLVTSVALYRAFVTEVGLPVTHFAGHSLGEYSALCCAGALTFADALALVRRRGEAISAVAEELDGSMAWVMGLEVERVARICRFWNDEEGREVYPAILDGPRQVAISGSRDDLRYVAEACEARGARTVPLRLTGPFHSPLMRDAAERMKSVLAGVPIESTAAPVYSNVTAQPHPGGAASAALLVEQVVSPVRWYDIGQRLVAEGVGLAVESGPGRILTFVLGNNGSRLRSWPVDDYPDLGALGAALRLGPADADTVLDSCARIATSTRSRQPETLVAQQFQRLESARRGIGTDAESQSRSIREGLTALDDLLAAKGLSERERLGRLAEATAGRAWTA